MFGWISLICNNICGDGRGRETLASVQIFHFSFSPNALKSVYCNLVLFLLAILAIYQ